MVAPGVPVPVSVTPVAFIEAPLVGDEIVGGGDGVAPFESSESIEEARLAGPAA
jgi:hypothetical protein